MTAERILPDSTRLGRSALVVADRHSAAAFYRDIVGLSVLDEDGSTATLGAGGTPLLVLTEDEDAPGRRREQAGLYHTAFRVPTRAALGAALERIRDGWRLDGASDHYVSEALYLTDPEGNGVEIYVDRPKEEWPRGEDGRIEIGTVPLDVDDVAAGSDGATDAPAGTTVGHLHLEVTSLERARSFYVDTLGLAVQTEMPSALFVAFGDYHHHFGLNTWHGRSEPAGGCGLAWFELVVDDEEALERVRRELADEGVPVEGGAEAVEITDPDGIDVRISAQ